MNINAKERYLAVISLIIIISATIIFPAIAQQKDNLSLLKTYQATPTKINDLIHTKLDVRFDYKKRYLYGKEWVTIKPHFYPTDSLRLDAKGMDIKTISLIKNGKRIPLKYSYDSLALDIMLDKEYKNNENYTIYIEYTAKPDELKLERSSIITDNKGLFFINPDSTEKNKPVQIWTQSALESASTWFPTIDKPNQKTTEEIIMTVPARYVTLSNGKLIAQKTNGNGTRTDTWKMDLPHAPYLFMMAVGDFKIYHDKWRNKEVNYYLEPQYAPYAKNIFGVTPEIMEFFSKKLGIDYPWNKYSQVVVRDYVSGAMENTTATLLINYVQGTARELADRYYDAGRSIIAHELFHHWFGDYVTTESWSNTTLNESFADFGETLWAEYKYGQDTGDDHNNQGMLDYMNDTTNFSKDLVRFYYHNAQDVFDGVSYQKGGRILNMLRNYLGAPAFFKGLNIYLKNNAFKNAEAHQLRLAMEEASGKDLNWFFNQWYYGAGHPIIDISYKWDEKDKIQTVFLKQIQAEKAFRLSMAIDLYFNDKKERHQIWMNSKSDTLTFKLPARPNLVNVDGDKITLAKKTDHKNIEEFLFQYQHASLYMDRYEAIETAKAEQVNPIAQKILTAALSDKYYGLRLKAMNTIDFRNEDLNITTLPVILNLAKTDNNNIVKAEAIKIISNSKEKARHILLYQNGLKSQSYAVAGACLDAIAALKPAEALTFAKSLEKDSKGALTDAIITIYTKNGTETEWPFVSSTFKEAEPQEKLKIFEGFVYMISRIQSSVKIQEGITILKETAINLKPNGVAPQFIDALDQIKKIRQQAKDNSSVNLIDAAIQEINRSR